MNQNKYVLNELDKYLKSMDMDNDNKSSISASTLKESIDPLSNMNNKISTLENNLTQYQNMSKKIDQAITELKAAKKHINTAYQELQNSYSGQEAIGKYNLCTNLIQKIDKQINYLKNTILPAVDNKVLQTAQKIQEAKLKKNQYYS